MSRKNKERKIDKNFFKAMNYEIAGELGLLDNEEMKKNSRLNSRLNGKKDDTIINPS